MVRILIVDDEPGYRDPLRSMLSREGHDVRAAATGREAVEIAADFAPDLILLDIEMPRLNGRQVCRELRAKGNWTPIIMLTKMGDIATKVGAFEEGADDYVVKPFDTLELQARIKATLKREQIRRECHPKIPPLAAARRLKCGNLVFDQESGHVSLCGEKLNLPPKAKDLLRYMMVHPGEVLSKKRLLETVWGWVDATDAKTRAVDKQVCDLRRYLKKDPKTHRCIQTLQDEGYVFDCQVEVKL